MPSHVSGMAAVNEFKRLFHESDSGRTIPFEIFIKYLGHAKPITPELSDSSSVTKSRADDQSLGEQSSGSLFETR